MTDTFEYEPLPEDVRDWLRAMGMNNEQAELCGIVAQKVKNFAIDCVCDGKETISNQDIAVAAVATSMAMQWLDSITANWDETVISVKERMESRSSE